MTEPKTKKWTQEDEDNLVKDMYVYFKTLDAGLASGADILMKRSIAMKDMAPDAEPMADYIRLHRQLDKAKGPKQLAALVKRFMKSNKNEVKRAAKNIAFAYKHIVLSGDDINTLKTWVDANNGIDPKTIVTGPSIKGMSLKAAKNFLGYLDSERMNMNKGYLRMLVIKYNDTGTMKGDDMGTVTDMTEGFDDEEGDELKESTQARDRGLTSEQVDFISKIRKDINTNQNISDQDVTELKSLLKFTGEVKGTDNKATRAFRAVFNSRYPE